MGGVREVVSAHMHLELTSVMEVLPKPSKIRSHIVHGKILKELLFGSLHGSHGGTF